MQFSELRQKEVVNIRDGMRLGYVEDLSINEKEGCICSLRIPCDNKLFTGWGKEKQYVIEWCKVKRIGYDIILVDIEPEGCCQEYEGRSKKYR